MSFNPDLCRNESEVESKLIVQYLLPTLGYDPTKWHQEVALGNIRLDFLAITSQIFPNANDPEQKICVVMEAKSPKKNLDSHVRRLKHYLTKLRVVYGVLTNGRDFRIYEIVDEQVKLSFQCQGAEIADKIEKIKGIIGRDKLAGIEASQPVIPPVILVDSPVSEPITKSIIEPMPEPVKLVIPKPKVAGNMKTIAIYHNKGGVGKTTTVVNLAAALSKKGKRVLIIDLDSQANTTFATGLVKFEDEEFDDIEKNNIYHVLESEDYSSIDDVARTSYFSNPSIDVVPSHISLMDKEEDLNRLDYSRMILVQKLKDVSHKYDVVIIDTPPSLNFFARVALIACDFLIIPSDLKPYANQGLVNVKNFIKKVNAFRKQINKSPIDLLGVLPNKISPIAKFVQYTLPNRLKKIPAKYELKLMDSIIYDRDDLAKCAETTRIVGDLEISDPKSIFEYKPDSMAAQEFELLAIEVLEKIGLK
jgi:cellulose biosynthesis protein BcsQ